MVAGAKDLAPKWNRFHIQGVSRSQPTIVEVAQSAGVAVSTVSRVLNGGPSSAKAQAKVAEAVSSLGFTPSAAARNLKSGKTGIVGIAGASARAPWFVELLDGMERVLSRNSSSLAICALERDGIYDPGPVRAWLDKRSIDQLVLVRPGKREALLATRAWKAGIPVVSLVPDVTIRRGISVIANNVRGGRLAGEHLLSLGHEKISFLGGPEESVDSQHRLEGLGESLGRPLPKSRVRFASSYEVSAGLELAQIWLKNASLRACTAVVLASDSLALGFMRAIHSAGVRIPQDVSVIGFDGVEAGALVWPALTTVAQPVTQMGAELADTLCASDAEQHLNTRMTRTYQLKLIVRESTSSPTSRP